MNEPAMDLPTRNVADLVERGGLGCSRLAAFAVLGACLVMDGFDVQALGYAAPAIVRDWGIPREAMGPVFSAGLLGLFVGSIVFGMVADRVGRRPVLIGATASFAAFTLLAARAGGPGELVALRFLAGLGLGAVMPNATALVGEYSPARRRVATMMIVTNGFMCGAVLAGLLSAWLLPAHGWRSIFLVGGAVPLAILVPMAVWLPESLQLLVVRGRSPAEVARWARRLDPSASAATRWVASEERRQGIPVLHLLEGGRARGTALLWIVSFMNVLDAYFVSSWLPTLVRDAGHPTSTAVLVGTAVQLGGCFGTFALGAAVGRVRPAPMLAGCFALAAAGLLVLGEPALPVVALGAIAFLVGWGIFAGQPGVNALAATQYPTDLRATGVGTALGVGRFGAILGPLLASALLASGWSSAGLFRVAAVPAVVSTLAMLALGRALHAAHPNARPPRASTTAFTPGAS